MAFAFVLSMLFEVPAINLMKLFKAPTDSEVTSSIVSRTSQIDDVDDDEEGTSGLPNHDSVIPYQIMEDDAFDSSHS